MKKIISWSMLMVLLFNTLLTPLTYAQEYQEDVQESVDVSEDVSPVEESHDDSSDDTEDYQDYEDDNSDYQEDTEEINEDLESEDTVTEDETWETTEEENNEQEENTNEWEENSEEQKKVQSAYEWAYKHEITTMKSLIDANPIGTVKRWHLAKMVVNYAINVLWLKLPEKTPSECRWNDYKSDWESEEIKEYAVKSCALWLMWIDMERFLPNKEVTRAQFGTIMSRLLWWSKYAWWTPYYRKHLNALKENGIMTQIDNPEKRIELRQRVRVMLMRSAEYKK